MPDNAPCQSCKEALHTWILNGMKLCDACYWEETAPYHLRPGLREYDATTKKGSMELTRQEWLVVERATGTIVSSRAKMISAFAVAGMMNAAAGHVLPDDDEVEEGVV